MKWIYLAIAIISEVIATSALKASAGFTRWLPMLIVVAGYVSSFYFLSLTLSKIPVGVAYAVWAGTGMVLVTFVGWVYYHQTLDLAAFIGIGLIIAGVLMLTLFSNAATH